MAVAGIGAIALGAGGTKSFGYDAAGRTTSVTTSAGTTTLSWDYDGTLSSITYPSAATNTFAYNGEDARVSKTDSRGTRTYKRDGSGVTDSVLSDGAANYTPGLSERRSGATKYVHQDHLGTHRRLTDSSQATTDTRQYDAFGLLVSSTGSTPSPFGFAGGHGYQEDADSGLKLLGHRYYDPSTGRFLSRDPAKDGRNWYGYASQSPLTQCDPTGLLRDTQTVVRPKAGSSTGTAASKGILILGAIAIVDLVNWSITGQAGPVTGIGVGLGDALYPDPADNPQPDRVQRCKDRCDARWGDHLIRGSRILSEACKAHLLRQPRNWLISCHSRCYQNCSLAGSMNGPYPYQSTCNLRWAKKWICNE